MDVNFNIIKNELHENKKKFLFFGFGKTCKEFYDFIKNDINIVGFIDNNINKHGLNYDNISITSLEKYKFNNEKIIITTNEYYKEIKEQLEKNGFTFNKDFYYYRDLLPLITYSKRNEVWLDQVDITITIRCTLKCEACCLGIPFSFDCKDLTIQEVKRDIELFFKNVDGVRNFVLVGGEPLICEHLEEIINLVSNYRKQIGKIKVVTNGTILPKTNILRCLAENNIHVAISDYGALSRKKDELIQILDKMKIEYTVLSNMTWSDYGDYKETNKLTTKELTNLFRKCAMPCRTLYDGKLWFCSRECAFVRMGLFKAWDDDYLDFTEIKHIDNNWREKLIRFDFGINKTGFLKFCSNCNGSWLVNDKLIPAAKQL